MEVICPTCGAPPGERCRGTKTMHEARDWLADDIKGKKRKLRRHKTGGASLYARYDRGLRLRV